jgi:hypothetical protein
VSCGCDEICNCAVIGGNCVQVVGDGRPTSPYTIDVVISPDADNAVSCEPNGLFGVNGLTVTDTDCIDLAGTGKAADPLSATAIISPDAGNRLECRANGLYAYPCPDIYCCCDEPAVDIDASSSTFNLHPGCELEIPDGDYRVNVEILIVLEWDPDQASALIQLVGGYTVSGLCTLPDMFNVNCEPVGLTTQFRTPGVGFPEVETLFVIGSFDVTGPLTVTVVPQIVTGASHAAVVTAETYTVTAIVGQVPADQPNNLCSVCIP